MGSGDGCGSGSSSESGSSSGSVFVLGGLDGIQHGLAKEGQGGGGFALYASLRHAGEDMAESGAETRMAGKARSAASAAIGEGERTQGRAVLGAKNRHGSLQK